MSFEPSAKQALGIFSLVFGRTDEERRPLQRKFYLERTDRQKLVEARFLELEPVRPPGKRVILTERGWAWAAAHLDSELSKSKSATQVLQNVLLSLRDHLPTNGSSLAEFVAGKPRAQPQIAPETKVANKRPPLPPADPLALLIRTTSLELGGGMTRVRVRLRELRARLRDVSRDRLDRALVDLQNAGSLVLYRIDDPMDIKPEDERAALQINGNPRHILYLE
jgi:hypothetical protein